MALLKKILLGIGILLLALLPFLLILMAIAYVLWNYTSLPKYLPLQKESEEQPPAVVEHNEPQS